MSINFCNFAGDEEREDFEFMTNEEIENILSGKEIKPTANRMLVLKELMKTTHPVNLADLEMALDPMNKASIFRVLELFSERGLIHVIEDGSRSLKYELCHGGKHHSVADQHAHFYCEKCGDVYCLEDVKLASIRIPEEYQVKSVNLMFKGTCPKCCD